MPPAENRVSAQAALRGLPARQEQGRVSTLNQRNALCVLPWFSREKLVQSKLVEN
jgi:hypothetical protein